MFSEIESFINIVVKLFQLGRGSHVQLSINRFKQLILEHEFSMGQLPNLLPDNLKQAMHAFSSDDLIAKNLTDELISWAATTFGVRREWLEAADDAVYPFQLSGYKNINGLFKDLEELGIMNMYTTMYIFTSDSFGNSSYAKLWVAFSIPFDRENEEDEHYKYIPLSDKWVWNYDNSRNHLIHIVNEFYKRGGHSTPVYKVSSLTMELMHKREIIPNIQHLRCKYYAESLV